MINLKNCIVVCCLFSCFFSFDGMASMAELKTQLKGTQWSVSDVRFGRRDNWSFIQDGVVKFNSGGEGTWKVNSPQSIFVQPDRNTQKYHRVEFHSNGMGFSVYEKTRNDKSLILLGKLVNAKEGLNIPERPYLSKQHVKRIRDGLPSKIRKPNQLGPVIDDSSFTSMGVNFGLKDVQLGGPLPKTARSFFSAQHYNELWPSVKAFQLYNDKAIEMGLPNNTFPIKKHVNDFNKIPEYNYAASNSRANLANDFKLSSITSVGGIVIDFKASKRYKGVTAKQLVASVIDLLGEPQEKTDIDLMYTGGGKSHLSEPLRYQVNWSDPVFTKETLEGYVDYYVVIRARDRGAYANLSIEAYAPRLGQEQVSVVSDGILVYLSDKLKEDLDKKLSEQNKNIKL